MSATSVGAYHAKTHLAELLDRVESGEKVTITRHGRPVAELVPPAGAAEMTLAEAFAELRSFREAHPLGQGLSVGELLREGRGP